MSNDDQEALASARAHVFRQQHAGTHEQDREDARRWMGRWGGGACQCEACERGSKAFGKNGANGK